MNSLCLVLLFFSRHTVESALVSEPDSIAARIYLGQYYPSGNVYLIPFPLPDSTQSEQDYLSAFAWPDSIFFRSLSSTDAFAKQVRKAQFVDIMHDERHEIRSDNTVQVRMYQLESAYIPGLESMDDSHTGCSERFYNPRNPNYRYLGEDFFFQSSYNCHPNEGIAIYHDLRTSKLSYPVIAYAPDLTLSNVKLSQGKHRPLTREESITVAQAKAQDKQNESEWTTIPKYLDAAIICLSANVKGSGLSIRLSSYSTSGTMGHWAKVYILDILRSGVLVKKYRLVQYLGSV